MVFLNKTSSNYYTSNFLEDIRNELEKIVPNELLFRGRLTDNSYSLVLGQGKNYVINVKRRIKKNPNFHISINMVNNFLSNIEKNYETNSIEIFFKKYKAINNLPIENYGVKKHHPNLKLNYFRIIDTIEKAYWLGWLYAEGFLTREGKIIRFGVEISLKDEILLNEFCKSIGFNIDYKSYSKRDNTVKVRFINNNFASNLTNLGYIIGKKKSKNIQLPILLNRELYLAFLLGYYDGDGIKNTTIIVSGSLVFLESIRAKFNIKNIIQTCVSEGTTIRHIKVKGKAYRLALGSSFFNEILDTIGDLIPDYLGKRRKFETFEEKKIRLRVYNFDRAIRKKSQISDIKITQKYAWELGRKYEFPYFLIVEKCKEFSIKKPTEDYWNKIKTKN